MTLPARSVVAASERAAGLERLLRGDATASDHEGGFPSASIAALGDAGLLSAALPTALGGDDLGAPARTLELLRTLAAVGCGNLALGRIFEGHVNALRLVERHGTVEQRRRAADDACSGRLFGVWNTEAADGVRIVHDADGTPCLTGAKTFASGCGHVARAVVTAADAGGWQMLLLDTERDPPRIDPGFWSPLGMRATASFRADFTGRAVAPSERLGLPGDYYREPDFSGGAIRFAAVQLGGIQAIFDETRGFLGRLGRTADPFQRARLGEMAHLVEGGRLWFSGAAAQALAAMPEAAPLLEHQGDTGRPVEPSAEAVAGFVAYAHMMRSAIEAIGLAVMPLAERSVGARGLLRPEPFERLHRDLTHYLRQPGARRCDRRGRCACARASGAVAVAVDAIDAGRIPECNGCGGCSRCGGCSGSSGSSGLTADADGMSLRRTLQCFRRPAVGIYLEPDGHPRPAPQRPSTEKGMFAMTSSRKWVFRSIALAAALAGAACSETPVRNDGAVLGDASVSVVTARAAGGGAGPRGIAERFTTDGVVVAFVSIVWPKDHVAWGAQTFESRWYHGDRLVVKREITLNVARSPFNFYSEVFPVNLGPGAARYELHAGGKKLAEKSFDIVAPG